MNISMEFEDGGKTFIYQPKLTSKTKYGTNKPIPQNTISNYKKMNIFFSTLTKESGKEEEFLSLYKDSINLYGKDPHTFDKYNC